MTSDVIFGDLEIGTPVDRFVVANISVPKRFSHVVATEMRHQRESWCGSHVELFFTPGEDTAPEWIDQITCSAGYRAVFEALRIGPAEIVSASTTINGVASELPRVRGSEVAPSPPLTHMISRDFRAA